MRKEESLQIAVCNYLRLQYPAVIFTCDLASGMKLTMGQAVRATKMRSSRGLPDLFIAEPRGGYAGMFIELKKEGTKIILNNGQMTADKHIQEQAEILKKLQAKGYDAIFCVGFNEAKKMIDNYMNSPK